MILISLSTQLTALQNELVSPWVPLNALGISKAELAKVMDKSIVSRTFRGKTFVTFEKYRRQEQFIANFVYKMAEATFDYDVAFANELIDEYEKNESKAIGFDFRLADEQREGVHLLLKSKIAIITGGPGTGKTSVLKCAAFVLESITGLKIDFCAPTGKAARRITESTGYPACTINSKIGDGIETTSYDPLIVDILVLDEVSMLDMDIFYKTLKVFPASGRLFLLGDVDQLPSVGIGAVLRDLIDSKVVPYCKLEKTFRQDNSSVLFENIQITRKGGNIPFYEGDDFIKVTDTRNILSTVLSWHERMVSSWGLKSVVLLTPYRRKGALCANNLNRIVQEKYNPKGTRPYIETKVYTEDCTDGRWIRYQVGDPVIQLVNRKCGIANGDVGEVVAVKEGKVIVKFSDKLLSYRKSQLNQLELAYALSIHKSQGSEYPCVISPFSKENTNLDRNLIYTAITRAKKCFVCIGEDKVIMDACKVQSAWERFTFLAEELQALKLKSMIMKVLIEVSSKMKGGQ